MTSEELKHVLAAHAAWRRGEGDKRADLRGADLRGAFLQGANLRGADLQGAVLRGANLQGADLQGAFLRGANLQGANLRGADLQGAFLQHANLQGANLRGAVLRGANLQGAKIADGITVTAAPARCATRADGHAFLLWQTNAGWRVKAGCRLFTLDKAWEHWERTRAGTPLGEESQDILTMFELYIQRKAEAAQ